MRAKISKTKNELVIKVPLQQNRYNPYMEKVVGEMDNIVALIAKDQYDNEEMGFAHWIDRSYKGKDDDVSDFWFKWWGDQNDFEKICKKLKISIVYL